MRKPIFSSLALITLTAVMAGCSNATLPSQNALPAPHAAQTSKPSTLKVEETNRWFVKFGVTGTGIQPMSAQTLSKLAADQNIDYQQNYTFSRVFNGVSVTATKENIDRIAALPGVVSISPVRMIKPAGFVKADPITPDLATAITQTGVDVAQNELGLTGKGIKVGVIDSGIDVDHPDLKGRIVAQKDFVGDNYGVKDSYIPKPDAVADDCGGHGTHVAGIVGANGTVKGVAPEVSFGAYRVFGCDGSTYDDILVAALEQSVVDQMDVVNMSLGSFGTWPNDVTSEAIKNAIAAGVIVVASAGNNGTEGPFALGGISGTEGAISVASYENSGVRLNYFTANGVDVGYLPGSDSAAVPTSGTMEMVRTGSALSTADACAALPADSLKGKVALVRRGGCTFTTKADNAKAAGAAAVVIYNNSAGYPGLSVVSTIPVMGTDKAVGEALDAKLAAGETLTVTWKAEMKSFVNPVGNLPSDFTSYGPDVLLKFKPDVAAPGGQIYSTYPLELGGYATLSGTSMASPHVAGIVALMLQARPELKKDSQKVLTLLQNNSNPGVFKGTSILDGVNRQGSGMVNVVNSIQNPVRTEPSRLSLEEIQGTVTRTIRLYNDGPNTLTYNVSHEPAVGTFGTSPVQFSDKVANVQLQASRVTLYPGNSVVLRVDITPPAEDRNGSMFSGYITFKSATGKTVRVPYMGYKGDYQTQPAMTYNFLTMYDPETKQDYDQVDGAVYDLSKNQFPKVYYHLAMPAQVMTVEVLNAATGKPLFNTGSEVLRAESLSRNQIVRDGGAYYFSAYTWNASIKKAQMKAGVPVTKTIADGAYRLKVNALRAGGDVNNAAHWDTWVSPVFYIKNAN